MQMEIDNTIKKAYLAAFATDDFVISDLMKITTKCLNANKNDRVVFIDKNRLKYELMYYKYYKKCTYDEDENLFLLNAVLPLIFSNKSLHIAIENSVELINIYVDFFKQNKNKMDYILASVCYCEVINAVLLNKNVDLNTMLENIKETIIGFNCKEGMLSKTENIKFQMKKIEFIQKLHDYIDLKFEFNEHNILDEFFEIIYSVYIENSEKTFGEQSVKNTLFSILGIKNNFDIENEQFLISMSEYIIKLRNFKLCLKLFDKKSTPLNFINSQVGEEILDPIINRGIVKKREVNSEKLLLQIQSKSGVYDFKYYRKK